MAKCKRNNSQSDLGHRNTKSSGTPQGVPELDQSETSRYVNLLPVADGLFVNDDAQFDPLLYRRTSFATCLIITTDMHMH